MRSYTTAEYLQLMSRTVISSPEFYRRPYLGPEKLQSWQKKRIKKIIVHAYTNTRFYNQLYSSAGVTPDDFHQLSDLHRFPIVTKQQMIDNFPAGNQDLLVSVSSGSTGQVISIQHNPADTVAYILGRSRILNMTGKFSPLSKTLYIYTSPYPANSFFGFYSSKFLSTLTESSLLMEKILQIRPDILCSYPSVLLALISKFKPFDFGSWKPKLIITGSETSTDTQRKSLQDFFQCPVLDEYSSEELGWIATQCVHGTYHMWDDISFIETLDGEIVGTNLHNFTIPFIRYRQSDSGVVSDFQKCTCGRFTRQLTRLQGRINDQFYFRDTVFSSGFLLDACYSLILDVENSISDYCLIQESMEKVTLQMTSSVRLSKLELEHMGQKLSGYFPQDVRISVVQVEELYKTKSGKRNPIICKVPNNTIDKLPTT
jgi:phenylacetate-CoA ligase